MKKIVSLICLIAFINAFIPTFAATKVPAGTTIPISINQKITSKNVASGASIKAKIDEDIIINNTLVFKKGDSASINVMSAEKAGFLGKPGELVLYGGKVYDVNGKPHSHEFSRQINGTEKIYSVYMTEEEYNLYSEKLSKDSKSAIGHSIGFGINSALAGTLGKTVAKKGIKNSKLAAAGALVGASNAVYHGVKAAKSIKRLKKNEK